MDVTRPKIVNLMCSCWCRRHSLTEAVVCVCTWVTMYVSVRSVVCMLHWSTWQVQNPVGWRCCVLHLAEHLQHIWGVTNPSLTARTFQRASVPVNNTSSGFLTSELMCVWHTDTHRWNVPSHTSVWLEGGSYLLRKKKSVQESARCVSVSLWRL